MKILSRAWREIWPALLGGLFGTLLALGVGYAVLHDHTRCDHCGTLDPILRHDR